MELVWGAIKNCFALIGSVFQILWSLIKFIFSKCWKFLLLIGSLLVTLFSIKKASKEE